MNKQLNNAFFIFKMVMSFFYIGIGLTLLISPNKVGTIIPVQYAPILGALLIIYGLFRGYRAYTVERK